MTLKIMKKDTYITEKKRTKVLKEKYKPKDANLITHRFTRNTQNNNE